MVLTTLAVLLACAGAASASPIALPQSSSPAIDSTSAGCHGLAIAFPSLTFYPKSANYTAETTHFWSAAAVLTPYCVFTPKSALDVATGLRIITATNTFFSVRSGGHMPVTGAASTDRGVLIGTTNLNKIQRISSPNQFNQPYVQVGPGLTWGQVYNFLGQYDLMALGGRVSSVGTSLLLGGGISYFAGTLGWSANNVVNFELVTADSRILQVNAQSHPDLFWALKGGSNNFGIVTRYDLKTYARGKIFGGSVTWDTKQVQQYLDAHTSFILPGGGSDDPKAAIMPNIELSLSTGIITAATVMLYDAADPSPRALQNFTNIPTLSSTAGVRKFTEIVADTAEYGDRSSRQSFYSTGVKAAPDTMKIITDTLMTVANSILSGVDCAVGAAIQPVTHHHLRAARAAGGDAIDLDPANGSFVVAMIYARWTNPADDAKIKTFSEAAMSGITARAKAKGIHYDFTFLNDAGRTQNPFAGYGGGRSLPKLKRVSKAYDPEGVFQRLTSGFKL